MKPILFLLLLLTAFPMDAQDRRRAMIAKVNADKAAGGGSTLENGLIAKWIFAEQTGTTVADSSGNGRTLTLTGSPTWGSAGPHGDFINFSGSGQYGLATSVAFATSGDNSVTISCWVKPDTTSSAFRGIWRTLNASIANFAVYHDSGNVLRLYYAGNDTVSSAVSAGTWYHVLIRQPTTTGDGEFWLNGVKLFPVSLSERRTMATSNLYVGGDEFAQYFDGDIALFRIYGRAVTDDEIAELAAE